MYYESPLALVLSVRKKVIIRPAQFDRLAKASTERFENDLVIHLNSFARRHCDVIGEENVRQVIRLGFEKCEGYGFTLQGSIRFFIELMFMFGSHFDTDVQHPWATEGLKDQSVSAELMRADAIHDRMTDYLAQISGPENKFTRKALLDTRRMAAEPPPTNGNDLLGDLLTRMEKAYPEKCGWLGHDRLFSVIEGGLSLSHTEGVTTPENLRLFAVLAFALGHRFTDDPLYPWVASTLNHSSSEHPNIRAEKLQRKALLYLDRVLVYLETN
jgi:hypothetical protein